MKKKISASVVFACLLAAVTMSAALAGQLIPGVREMLGLDADPGTEEMVQSVGTHLETEYVTAQIREMLYDGQGAYIALDVQKKDGADILLLPSGNKKTSLASPASALEKADAAEGESIAQYAERKGLPVVYFRAAAQNLDHSFDAFTAPNDLVSIGEDAWTMILRFPAVGQDEKILVRLYTTVYDSPVAQSALPAGKRPTPEPHSMTLEIPDFKNISAEKTVLNAVSVTENAALKGLTIEDAKLIRTPIATYLDLLIGNTDQTNYGSLRAVVLPLCIPLPAHISFGSPGVYSEGYASGARQIEIYPAKDFTCTDFQVDLEVSPMPKAEEMTGTPQAKKAGSVTISFGTAEN